MNLVDCFKQSLELLLPPPHHSARNSASNSYNLYQVIIAQRLARRLATEEFLGSNPSKGQNIDSDQKGIINLNLIVRVIRYYYKQYPILSISTKIWLIKLKHTTGTS